MKTLLVIAVLGIATWFYLYSPAADALLVRTADRIQAMSHGDPADDPLFGEARIVYRSGRAACSLSASRA